MKPIQVLYTGGTIGMVKDESTQALRPIDFGNIYQTVPLLREFEFPIDYVSLPEPMDSANIFPKHWDQIANVIWERFEEYDGFVVLHGTDTMAYTASALSFMFDNLTKPIIFTGSQLPIRMLRSDARDNLITSIEIAAKKEDGYSLVNEVGIYFEDELFRANRTQKHSATHFDAFKSHNYPSLATSGVELQYHKEHLNRADRSLPTQRRLGFSQNVQVLRIFPGLSQKMLSHVLSAPELQGVVLESFGAGNLPTQSWFLEELAVAVQRGVVLVNVSQCASGGIKPGLYSTSEQLQRIGIVDGGSMTTEAALTKLMSLLAQYPNLEEVKTGMLQSLKGER